MSNFSWLIKVLLPEGLSSLSNVFPNLFRTPTVKDAGHFSESSESIQPSPFSPFRFLLWLWKGKLWKRIEKLGCLPLRKNYTHTHTHTQSKISCFIFMILYSRLPLNAFLLSCMKAFLPHRSLLFHSFLSIYSMANITKDKLINKT